MARALPGEAEQAEEVDLGALESLDPPLWGRAANHWSAALILRPERTSLLDAAESALRRVVDEIPEVSEIVGK